MQIADEFSSFTSPSQAHENNMNSQLSNSDSGIGGGGVTPTRSQINNHHRAAVKRNKSQFSLTNEQQSSLIENDAKNENLARSFLVEPVEEEVLQPGAKAMNLSSQGSLSKMLGHSIQNGYFGTA